MSPSRAAALLAVAVSLVAASGAGAELTATGNLFVHFEGGLSPTVLPRAEPAPIAVRIEGTIRTLNRADPPPLRRIEIALNRGGRLSTRGLPICHRNRIDPATPAQALARCGGAFVGGGGFTAKTNFEDQANELLNGEILLFNTKSHGHAAILAYVYQREPLEITRYVVFHIRHTAGQFGTLLRGEIPSSLNRNGYLKSIYLQLHRRYAYRGRTRSYLSASCPTPRGIRVAPFPFARASMTFGDGRTLSSVLTRTCRARDGR